MEDKKSANSLLHQKSLCVISGASRGIGKEMAIRLSTSVAPKSKFLLLSRNEKDLLETANEIRQKTNNSVIAEIFPCDLGKFEGDSVGNFEKKFQSLINSGEIFDAAFLIHNAGTIGDISNPVAKVENAMEIRDYLDMNVVSCVLLNNNFLKVLGSDEKIAKQKVIINITSLLAIKSLPGFGLYAMGKAAREAFMRSLTAEDSSLRVLNYSPGPVKTEMTNQIKDNVWDEGSKEWFKNAFESGTLLTTEQTVTKFLRVLDENTFENGVHLDYYDVQ